MGKVPLAPPSPLPGGWADEAWQDRTAVVIEMTFPEVLSLVVKVWLALLLVGLVTALCVVIPYLLLSR